MNKLYIVDYKRNDKNNTDKDEMIVCNANVNEKGIFEDVKFRKFNGELLKKYIATLSPKENILCNFNILGHQVVPKGYNFDCFANKIKPSIVANIIKTKAGTLLGYSIIKHDGRCMRIKLNDAITLAKEAKSTGCVAFQNCIYVSESDGKKAYLRASSDVLIPDFIIQDSVNKVNSNTLRKAPEAPMKEKVEFNKNQMEQLELGKQAGIKYSVYANPKLSAEQMKQIRLLMEAGFNGAYIAFPEYSIEALKFYLTDYRNGADIRYYLSPKYEPSQLFQLSLGVANGADIKQFNDPKLNSLAMEEIRNRLETKIWTKVKYDIGDASDLVIKTYKE